MNTKSNIFNNYVIRGILTNNEYGITDVKDIEYLASRCFLQNEYAVITEMIKSNSINEIKTLPENSIETSKFPREYLELLMFRDQNNNRYIVSVYDSDELLQDPEIIEIFQIK